MVVISNVRFFTWTSLKFERINKSSNSLDVKKFSTDSGKYLYAFEFENNDATRGKILLKYNLNNFEAKEDLGCKNSNIPSFPFGLSTL